MHASKGKTILWFFSLIFILGLVGDLVKNLEDRMSRPKTCPSPPLKPPPTDALLSLFNSIKAAQQSPHPPLLSAIELYAISLILTVKSASTLLVFGVNEDARYWCDINGAGGKTYFLEHERNRIQRGTSEIFSKLSPMSSDVSLIAVEYNGTVATASSFFKTPYLMKVPSEIVSVCYDVILLDGPSGYTESDPGRMEAGYFAAEAAKRCVLSGELDAVYVFMHDSERDVEKRIIKEYFSKDADFLIKLNGLSGELEGWKFSRKTVQVQMN